MLQAGFDLSYTQSVPKTLNSICTLTNSNAWCMVVIFNKSFCESNAKLLIK